jgi:5-methylcytosine-specific restriction endonuclease McrBC GTP-binding regulatory subunit McrB
MSLNKEEDTLYNDFIATWPISRLYNMPLEDYTNLERTSFCYWLEIKLDSFGGIKGGSSFKFGIYRRNNTATFDSDKRWKTDGIYGWAERFGADSQTAYENIRKNIIAIAEHAAAGEFEQIDDINLFDIYKWKIAFLYSNQQILPIFKKVALENLAYDLGLEDAAEAPYSVLYKHIMQAKPDDKDVFSYAQELWDKYKQFDDANYYIIGSKYGGNRDMFPQMFKRGVISTGFAGDVDLTPYAAENHQKLKEILFSKGHDANAWNTLKYFRDLQPGDKIAVKADGSPKGTTPFLSIIALAEVIEVDGKVYEYDPDELGHIVHVQYTKAPVYKTFPLGYGRTLHKLSNSEHIKLIFESEYEITETPALDPKPKIMAPALKHSLNTILYGPPGTGKTYSTIIKALSIIEQKSEEDLSTEERQTLKSRFDQYVDEERIAFITFHQNMSYEDFIEGIKPEFDNIKNLLKYPTKPGLFRQICLNAIKNLYRQNSQEEETVDFDHIFGLFIDGLKRNFKEDDFPFVTKEGSRLRIGKNEIYDDKIVVYYEWSNSATKQHPGKTPFTLKKTVLEKMFIGGVTDNETNLKTKLTPYTTYHLSPYYAIYKSLYAFINMYLSGSDGKLREQVTENIEDEMNYESYIEKLQQVISNRKTLIDGKPYILIIDEINRGNVSQIFGELITLLEKDKRLGCLEALIVKLPYSKESFTVPLNLFVIGTMNTADRSVEALDTALRRRFSFIEMPPIYNLTELKKVIEGIHLGELLQLINKRIEKLLTKDNLIGHSYFVSINSLTDLKSVFHHNITPLLQEYFYGDFGKIGLVIGKGFFAHNGEQEENGDTLFADFSDYSTAELLEKPVYRLLDATKMSDSEFLSAIETLLNKKLA